MKIIKKLGLMMLALVMLLPTFVMEKEYEEYDMKSIEDEIKATIDYADEELYGTKYSLRSAGVADFAVYHRRDPKLSMADGAFDKEKSIVDQDENNYIFTLYTKPVTKEMFGKEYKADCTELKFIINGQEVNAEPIGYRESINIGITPDSKDVPTGFKITVPKTALFKANVDGYSQFFRIKFETNLKDSGGLGVVGDKMMNRNARMFVK